MRKFYYFLLFISLYGCNESLPPLSINPYDPASKYFIGNPATSIQLETLGRSSVRLCWKDSSSFEKGYIIEKTNLNTQVTEQLSTGENENFLLDNDLDILVKYKYKVATKTSTGYFKFTDSLTIQYNPYSISSEIKGFIPAQISGNSNRCYIKSGDNGLDIYDINTGVAKYLRLANISVYAANILSNDGSYIGFAGGDRIGYYNIDNNKTIIFRQSSIIGLWPVADISTDKKYLVAVRDDHKIELWDIQRALARSFQIPLETNIRELYISPGNRFIVGRDNKFIYFWDLMTFNLYCKIANGGSSSNPCCFSDDGNTFLYYNYDLKKICFWDVNSKTKLCDIPSDGYNSIRFIRGGDFLAVYVAGLNNSNLTIWQMRNKLPFAPFTSFSTSNQSNYNKSSIANNGDVLVYGVTQKPALILRFKDNWKVVN